MEQWQLNISPDQIESTPYAPEIKDQWRNDPQYKAKWEKGLTPPVAQQPLGGGASGEYGPPLTEKETVQAALPAPVPVQPVPVAPEGSKENPIDIDRFEQDEKDKEQEKLGAAAIYNQAEMKPPAAKPTTSGTAPSPFDPAAYASQLDATQKQLLQLDNIRIDNLEKLGTITPEQANQQRKEAKAKYESETVGRLVDIQKLIREKGFDTKKIVASQNYNDKLRLQSETDPIKEQQKAIQEEADAKAEEAQKRSQMFRSAAEEQQALSDQQNARLMKNQEIKQQAFEEYKKANDELGNMKIDPNRMFRNQSDTTQVVTMLGAMLSGYFAGKAGSSKNPAMEFIDKAIDRDIDAQKSAIEVKRAQLAGKQNQYTMLRQQGLDDAEATNLLLANKLKNVQLQTDQLASQYADPAIKARAVQLNAELQGKIAAAESNLSQLAEKRVIAANTPSGPSTSDFWKKRGFTPVPGSKTLLIDNKTGKIVDVAAVGKESAKGGGKLELSDSERKTMASTEVGLKLLGRMAETLGAVKDPKSGQFQPPTVGAVAESKIPYSDKNNKLTQLKGGIIPMLGQLSDLGVLQPSDREYLEKLATNLTLPSQYQAFLNETKQRIVDRQKAIRDVAEEFSKSGSGQRTEE